MLRGTEFHFQILIMQYESYSQGQNEIRFSSFCNYEFSKYVYVHVGDVCVCVCARLTEISTSGKHSELSIIKLSHQLQWRSSSITSRACENCRMCFSLLCSMSQTEDMFNFQYQSYHYTSSQQKWVYMNLPTYIIISLCLP